MKSHVPRKKGKKGKEKKEEDRRRQKKKKTVEKIVAQKILHSPCFGYRQTKTVRLSGAVGTLPRIGVRSAVASLTGA